MPTDMSAELANIFKPLMKSKLKKAGYRYAIQVDHSLFDNEFDEGSENEDTWDNQA